MKNITPQIKDKITLRIKEHQLSVDNLALVKSLLIKQRYHTGKLVAEIRKSLRLSQCKLDTLLKENGIKCHVARLEKPNKGKTYSVETSKKVLDFMLNL